MSCIEVKNWKVSKRFLKWNKFKKGKKSNKSLIAIDTGTICLPSHWFHKAYVDVVLLHIWASILVVALFVLAIG